MKKAHFLLRALVLFVVFLILGAGIYRFSKHHYKNVAEWGEPNSQDVLIYKDDTYYYVGKIGDYGLNSKKYAKNEVLGEVTPESLWDKREAFVVWNLDGKANFLIVAIEDEQYLYHHESIDNPIETETAKG